MPKLPRAAADTRPGPALSRTGPETPRGGRLGRLGVSAPSGTSRDLSTVSLRSVCSGSYRGHSTAWAMAPLFTAWLTGYVKPIVETRCSEKNPFQNMPAPGQGTWPRQSPTAAGGRSQHTRQTAAPTDAGHRRAGARLRQPRQRVRAAGIASRAWAPRAGLQHGGHTTAALPGTPGHPSSPVRLAARRRPERNRRVAPAPGTARAPRRTNTGSWTPRPAAARLPQRTWKYSLESTGGRAGASPTAERRLQRQPHHPGLFRIFCGLTRILVFQNICTYINKATGISTEIALNFNNINVLDP